MATERVLNFSEPSIGLEAVLVIDSTVLGPAAGGIRTARYADRAAATRDAQALARAMTIKCSLAGLDAGGGKAVIIEQEGWDRSAVFRRFGEIVEDLQGAFRTAGDLGTSEADLLDMATTCQYVHTQEAQLGDAVAQGLVACMKALAEAKERQLSDLDVAIQGCGAIGSAVARALVKTGANLKVADIRTDAAQALANTCAAAVIATQEFLSAQVDVLSPCAVGGVIHQQSVRDLKAWGICGGANNCILDEATQEALIAKKVLVVPDVVASAGAVIDGIGDTVMHLPSSQRAQLIEQLGSTAKVILSQSQARVMSAQRVAHQMALARIDSRAD